MTLAEHFEKADQVAVTDVAKFRSQEGWLSARKYPPELKPGEDEAGMIIEGGKIVQRVFAIK